MNKIKNEEILFLTPTIGTRWLLYQQYLINRFFPESKRVLIDGNLKWYFNIGIKCLWYDFARVALKYKNKFKYFIHIDEDCFITDAKGLIEAVSLLEIENADLIGPADVIPRIRNENPKALNSFLMIGKISSLEQVMKSYEIDLTFDDLCLNHQIFVEDDKKEFEPYYDFFWNYYNHGFKIINISTCFVENLKCTGLLDNNARLFGYHMWFTRMWNSKKDTIGCGVSSFERYMNMKKFLKNEFNISFLKLFYSLPNDLKAKYLAIIYSRIVKKPLMHGISRFRKIAAIKTRVSKLGQKKRHLSQ